MVSQMYFKSTLLVEKLGRKKMKSVLLYITPQCEAEGRERGEKHLTVWQVMELAVWPDSEDHLQTTTFISCTAVSDAKDDTSGDNTAYDATQAEKRGLLTWARFTSGMVCIIQTTCISFMVVQTTKDELRKLKFKTLNLLWYRAGLQQGVIPPVWRENSTFICLEPIKQKCSK